MNKQKTLAEESDIIYRPWGSFQIIAKGHDYQVKQLIVNPGGKLSLQSHKRRDERWTVVQGEASVFLESEERKLTLSESIIIKRNEKHRLCNNSNIDLIVIETQFGDYLEDDDICRFEDIYGRV